MDNISHEQRMLTPDTLYCRVAGALDAGTSIELEGALSTPLKNAAVRRVILDVPDLTFVSSSGLRIFMLIIKTLTPRQGRLFMVGAASQVEQLVKMSGMSKWIDLRNNISECTCD